MPGARLPSAYLGHSSLVARHELRRRWRALLLLGLLAAVWAGATMTAAAGARRTASVVDRFLRATNASDATFSITDDRDGSELLRALRGRPEVLAADVVWSATTGVAYADRGLLVSVAAGLDGHWGTEFDRPIVVRGRLPDPTDSTEVVVNQAAADLLGISPGDHLALPTWDKAKYDAWFATRGAFPPFDGPLVEVAVVGVVRLNADLSPSQDNRLAIRGTGAFVDRWKASVGDNTRAVAVLLSDPQVDVDDLVESLTMSLGAPVGVTTTDEAYASATREATRASVVALVVLALAIGITGGLAVVAGVAREIRWTAERTEPLRALGATPAQRAVALSTPIALAGLVATGAAVVSAATMSGLFPVGPGRIAEPEPGLRLDWPVLVGSIGVVALMITTSVYCATREPRVRSGRHIATARARPVLAWLGPAVTIGWRTAFGSRSARTTLVLAVVTISGLTAATWSAHSLEQLDDHPDRWGFTWSSSPELGVPADAAVELVNETTRDPAIASVGYVLWEALTVNGRAVTVRSIDTVGGVPMEPTVLAGRLPLSRGEIALGERTAGSLGIEVGDVVTVDTVDVAPAEWMVVGFVVPPQLLGVSQPGEGAYIAWPSASALFPDRPWNALSALTYEPGADARVVEARLTEAGWSFLERSRPDVPGAVGTLASTSVLAVWLGVYFIVLGAAATGLAAARDDPRDSRTRRILTALGFTRGDVRRSMIVESVTVLVIGWTGGIVGGLALGHVAWSRITDRLGIVSPQSSPVVVVAGVLLLATIGAAAVSVLDMRRAGRADAAAMLHDD